MALPDSVSIKAVAQFVDSILSASYQTGATYQEQTGDNGSAVNLLILVLIGSIVWGEIRAFIQTRNLGKDRSNARSEILSAIERVRVDGVGAIARVESENEQLSKRVEGNSSSIAFLKGRIEK